MSNGAGAYGLVPAALRETGRTMRDIIGTEAESRVSKAQQGLEMTKLQYGLGKDIRAERQRREQLEYERGMDAPTTAAGALDFFVSTGQVTPEQKETMLKSEMFQLLKNETTMGGGRPVTARSIITIMDTLRKEKKATADAEKKEISDLVAGGKYTSASIEKYKGSRNMGDLTRLASDKTTEVDTQRRFDAKQKALARKNKADLYTAVNKEYTEQFTDSWTKKPVEGAPNRRKWVKETVNRRLEEESVASARETEVQSLAAMYNDLKRDNPDATPEELKAMLAGSGAGAGTKGEPKSTARPAKRRGGAGGGFTQNLTISEAATALAKGAKRAVKPATGEQIQRALKQYTKEGIIDKESFEKVAKELGIAASWAWDSVKAIGQTRIPFTSGLR